MTLVSPLGYLLDPALGKELTRDLKISEDAMAPGSRLQDLTAKYMQNPRRYFVPLANEYRNAQDLDRAISLCREHLPAQPGHMSGHIVLGRAYFEKGDLAAAQEIFLISVALDDENLIALRHLGDIAVARHDATEARQWYTRVLDADPQNDEIEQLIRSLGLPGVSEAVTAPSVAPSGPELVFAPVEVDEPTPPGLRAITDPAPLRPPVGGDTPASAAPPTEAWRTLGTMDLSTLGDADVVEAENVVTGDGGVGFSYGDLDQLVDPSSLPIASGNVVPSVDQTAVLSGAQPPVTPAVAPASDGADDLLSRPGFGALASFASWRTAQARDTPSSVAAAGLTPADATPTVPALSGVSGGHDAFDEPGLNDSAPTAPEFVTETMAALYAQQGFTRQALDVYQALLLRSPEDAALRAKITELEGVIGRDARDIALEDDADKALQFGSLGDDTSGEEDGFVTNRSTDVSHDDNLIATPGNDRLGDPWEREAPALQFASDDDWFAEGARSDEGESGAVGDDLFGVPADGFGAVFAPESHDRGRTRVPAAEFAYGTPIAKIFDATEFSSSDEAAADFLTLLATEMVGRLPRLTPSLPVPDLLDLPSSRATDAGGEASAPLLSFDRFFSGSGSPPRPRIDTPSASGTPMSTAPRASLSPTFGGMPVVQPPAWPGFDQFVSPAPAAPASPVIPSEPLTSPSMPAARADAHTVPTPVAYPAGIVAPPAPEASVALTPPTIVPLTPPDSELIAPPTPVSSPQPAAPAPPQDAEPPSEFHRWLKGLS